MSQRARDIDSAAYGVIYGTITVMGVLAAIGPDAFDPMKTALKLFVSVLVVAIAKTYADLAATAITSGAEHSPTTIRSAWGHSRTILLAANGPTIAMIGAAAGFYDAAIAMILAQICAMGLLVFYGWRAGWRISGRVLPAVWSACAFGGCGLALTALKHAVH